jgi:hypothetical protein
LISSESLRDRVRFELGKCYDLWHLQFGTKSSIYSARSMMNFDPEILKPDMRPTPIAPPFEDPLGEFPLMRRVRRVKPHRKWCPIA